MKQNQTDGVAEKRSKVQTSLALVGMGLGVAELAAPAALGRAVGLPGGTLLRWGMRLVGVRDLALSAGTMRRRRRPGWLWARAGADLLDLALLGWAYRQSPRRLRRRSLRLPLALGATAGMAIFDVVRAVRATRAERTRRNEESGEQLGAAVTIDRSAEDVYSFLRDPGNVGRFLSNVQSVQMLSDGRADVLVKGPKGPASHCLATLIDSRPGKSLTWIATTPAGDPFCGGTVRLTKAPGERGTEVRLALDGLIAPGGGGLGASIMRLWTREKIRNDLRRLKQILEIGDATKSDASVHSGTHAARPSWRQGGNGGANEKSVNLEPGLAP